MMSKLASLMTVISRDARLVHLHHALVHDLHAFFWFAMCFLCVILGLYLRFHLKPFYLSVYVRHLIKRHYFYCEIHCKLRVKNKCVQ